MARLTKSKLHHILTYEPKTGIWTWHYRADRAKKWNSRHAGKRAGCRNLSDYWVIRIEGVLYYGYILAWLYMTGRWPQNDIDHRNGCPGDDWWTNLRAATRSDNLKNQKTRKDNALGLKGVRKHHKRYVAHIKIKGKCTHLGTFDTAEEAYAARMAVAIRTHGEFVRA